MADRGGGRRTVVQLEPPPRPVGGWTLVGVYLAAQIAPALVIGAALATHPPATMAAGDLRVVRWTYLLSPLALLVAGLGAIAGGRSARRIGGRLAPWPGGLALLVGGAVGLLLKLAVDAVALLEQALTGPMRGNNPITLYPRAFATPQEQVALLVSVAVVAPAGEELFFRGLLYGWLRHRLGVWPAALVGGTLFGLAHVDPVSGVALLQTLPLALPLAIVGVGLCLLYERRRSLWVTAAAHAAFNLSSMLVVLAL
jgi:membrane protease YdiL (CAAX protease family)